MTNPITILATHFSNRMKFVQFYFRETKLIFFFMVTWISSKKIYDSSL